MEFLISAAMESNSESSHNDDKNGVSWLELSKSDYAKVIFCDLYYRQNVSVGCRFQITDNVHEDPCDYIGLFRVGYDNISQCLISKMLSETQCEEDGKLLCCEFKWNELPELEHGFYQFIYITRDKEVCGASMPFEVKHSSLTKDDSSDEDVVAEKVEDDFLLVKSNTKEKVSLLQFLLDKYRARNLALSSELEKNMEEKEKLMKEYEDNFTNMKKEILDLQKIRNKEKSEAEKKLKLMSEQVKFANSTSYREKTNAIVIVSELTKKLEALNDSAIAKDRDISKLSVRLKEMTEQVRVANSLKDKFSDKCEDLQKLIMEKETELKKIKEFVDIDRGMLLEQIEQQKLLTKAVEDNKQLLSEDLCKLSSFLNEQYHFEKKLGEKNTLIGKFEKELEEKNALIEKFEKELEEKNVLIEKELEEKNALTEKFEKELEKKNALIKNYEEELEEKNALIKNYEEELEEKNALFKNYEEELEAKSALIKICNEELDYKNALVKDYEEELEAKSALIKICNEELDYKNALVKDYEEELEEKNALFKNYDEELEEKNALIKNYEEELEEKSALIEKCEKEEEESTEIEKMNNEISNPQDDVENSSQMKEQLDEMNNEISNPQDDVENTSQMKEQLDEVCRDEPIQTSAESSSSREKELSAYHDVMLYCDKNKSKTALELKCENLCLNLKLADQINAFREQKKSFDQLKSEYQSLKSELEEAVVSYNKVIKSLDEYKHEISKLKSDMARLKSELAKETDICSELKKLLNDKDHEITALNLMLQVAPKQLEKDYESEVAEKSVTIEKLIKEKIDLEKELEQQMVLGNKLLNEKEDLKKELAGKIVLVDELNVEISYLRDIKASSEEKDLNKIKEHCIIKDSVIEYLYAENNNRMQNEANMHAALTDSVSRLNKAAELYKKQFLKISKLKRKIKEGTVKHQKVTSSEIFSEASASSASLDAESGSVRKKVPSDKNINDSDTGEHVSGTTVPLLPQIENNFPGTKDVSEKKETIASCQKNNANDSSAGAASESSKSPKNSVFREQMITESSEPGNSAVAEDEIFYSVPCAVCEIPIQVSATFNENMMKHLENVHQQQMCPICGRLYSMGLPEKYFLYHVEDHFDN